MRRRKGSKGKEKATEWPDLDEFVEEGEDHGGVGVVARHGDEVEVALLDVHEGDARRLDQRRHVALLFALHQQRQKLVNEAHLHVAAVVPRDQHLPTQSMVTRLNLLTFHFVATFPLPVFSPSLSVQFEPAT